MAEFNSGFIADLAFFMRDYVEEIRNHLIEEAEIIAANPVVCKLLHEYRARSEAQNAEFERELRNCLLYGYSKPSGKNCLLHPESYREVLNDLLVKEWWHEYCEAEKAKEAAAK